MVDPGARCAKVVRSLVHRLSKNGRPSGGTGKIFAVIGTCFLTVLWIYVKLVGTRSVSACKRAAWRMFQGEIPPALI